MNESACGNPLEDVFRESQIGEGLGGIERLLVLGFLGHRLGINRRLVLLGWGLVRRSRQNWNSQMRLTRMSLMTTGGIRR